MSAWTDSEIQEAQNVFVRIKERGFPVPSKVLFGLTESFFTISIECAVIRVADEPQALWIKRPSSDRYYPGMWHMPGKMQLPHEPMMETVRRTVRKEVGFEIDADYEPQRIGFFENPNGERGHEQQHQFCVLVPSEVAVTTEADESHMWVNVSAEPQKMIIPTHMVLLQSLRKYLSM